MQRPDATPMGAATQNARSRLDSMLGGPGGTPSGQHVKSEVNYRPADAPQMACGTCVHGQFPGGDQGSCEIVAGPILAQDVCDLFAPAQQAAPAAPAPGGAPGPMAG